MGTAWSLIKQTFSEWNEDKVPRLGAALSYYATLSLAPLLVIVIAVAGLAFGEEAVSGRIQTQLVDFVGEDGAEAIQGMIESARDPSAGIIATIIGVITLFFAASGVFAQLKDALNTIWEVKPDPELGFMGLIKDRFLSMTMVLGIAFLLLIALVVSTVIQGAQEYVFGPGNEWSWLISLINAVVSFIMVTLLFALIFKILPDVEVAWRDVWIGAAVTALLFSVGKYLISMYATRAAPDSSLTGAGALIAVLIWIFYSSQILFLGAEFTQVYANRYGSRVRPSKYAVAVDDEDRQEQGIPRDKSTLPTGRVAQRPVWMNKQAHAAEVVTMNNVKKLKQQRYMGVVLGFVSAVLMGALRSPKDPFISHDDKRL